MKNLIKNYSLDEKKLAQIIDHTLLKPEAKEADIKRLCQEAKKYNFGTVCINPYYVKFAKSCLKNSKTKVCTVVGFPLGASTTKPYETEKAIKDGASEIDMVINVSALKSKKYNHVKKDIRDVVKAANDKTVKVILETCLLTKNEIVKACQISKNAGAHFVKTSTGFNKEGATIQNVTLMREVIGDEMGIKAAGGIKTLETALKMIRAGAPNNNLEYLFRIGTSSGTNIVDELKRYLRR